MNDALCGNKESPTTTARTTTTTTNKQKRQIKLEKLKPLKATTIIKQEKGPIFFPFGTCNKNATKNKVH